MKPENIDNLIAPKRSEADKQLQLQQALKAAAATPNALANPNVPQRMQGETPEQYMTRIGAVMPPPVPAPAPQPTAPMAR